MQQKQMLTDPKILGPGIWITIHLKGKLAIDDSKKEDFIKEMYFHYHNFPCMNCRKHIQEYVDGHPFEPFYNMQNENGREIGMFKWSWFFHNAVNTRLNKPYIDWETASEMYQLDEDIIVPCTDCGSEHGDKQSHNNSSSSSSSTIDKSKIVQGYFLKKGVPEYASKTRFY